MCPRDNFFQSFKLNFTFSSQGRYQPWETTHRVSVRKENEDDLEYNVRRALERKDWKDVRRLLKQNLGPLREDLMDSIELFSNDNYLHVAAHLGHCGLVRLLIKHGCDVNAVTQSTHHTALHEAAYCGHVDRCLNPRSERCRHRRLMKTKLLPSLDSSTWTR